MMDQHRPILLVEDDDIDALAVKRAMRDLNIVNGVEHAYNCEEALDYLESETSLRPCIILLDLNMPRMNGLEFLDRIKTDPKFRTIPVIVLTTSQEQNDCRQSYDKGIAGYMVKPVDYMQFVETMRTINLYWTLSEIPN